MHENGRVSVWILSCLLHSSARANRFGQYLHWCVLSAIGICENGLGYAWCDWTCSVFIGFDFWSASCSDFKSIPACVAAISSSDWLFWSTLTYSIFWFVLINLYVGCCVSIVPFGERKMTFDDWLEFLVDIWIIFGFWTWRVDALFCELFCGGNKIVW